MAWGMLVLSVVAFYFSWSVRSPLWMALCMLAGIAALGAFGWLRYRELFPNRHVALEDTPLSVEEAKQMHAAMQAQRAAGTEAPRPPLPAESHPSAAQMRAAAERVALRNAEEARKQEALRKVEESERRAAEAEARIAEMEQKLAAMQAGTHVAGASAHIAATVPNTSPSVGAMAEPGIVTATPASATRDSSPLAAPRPAPEALPDLREQGWNPYGGIAAAPPTPRAVPIISEAGGNDLDAMARQVLQPFFQQEPWPAGMPYRGQVDMRKFDFSLDSLAAVDALLDHVRERERPEAPVYLQARDHQAFLQLLGFYVGTTVGINARQRLRWLDHGQMIEAAPEKANLPRNFVTAMSCRMENGGLFFPLDAICRRLFRGEAEQTVQERAAAFLAMPPA